MAGGGGAHVAHLGEPAAQLGARLIGREGLGEFVLLAVPAERVDLLGDLVDVGVVAHELDEVLDVLDEHRGLVFEVDLEVFGAAVGLLLLSLGSPVLAGRHGGRMGWASSAATRALLACSCESSLCMEERVVVEMRFASDSMRWAWRGQGAVWSALQSLDND